MADAAATGSTRSGSALRVYQILFILGVGWLAGRVPALLADNSAEESRLMAALQPVEMSAPQGAGASIDAAAIASQVAAQVAAQVANETVARLIAAGWGPRGNAAPPQIIVQQLPAGRAPETVVRVITESAPAQLAGTSYSLPPGPSAASPSLQAPSNASPDAPAPHALAAYAAAAQGYVAIKAGNRREGVRQLSEAVLLDPTAPQATAWAADVKRLSRRWTLAAYTLAREGGSGDPVAASPVLGGGQSGAAFAFTLDPLAKRPISAVARVAAATGPSGVVDRDTAEAALGIRLQPLPKIPLAIDVERRFALGELGRNAWSARISGGTSGSAKVLNRTVKLETYGEAGIINFKLPDLYAGMQARAATPLFSTGRVSVDAGAGAWAATQDSYNVTATRFDIGPSTRIAIKPWPFSAQIDYRFRMAGNALPASGPALTVSGEF